MSSSTRRSLDSGLVGEGMSPGPARLLGVTAAVVADRRLELKLPGAIVEVELVVAMAMPGTLP